MNMCITFLCPFYHMWFISLQGSYPRGMFLEHVVQLKCQQYFHKCIALVWTCVVQYIGIHARAYVGIDVQTDHPTCCCQRPAVGGTAASPHHHACCPLYIRLPLVVRHNENYRKHYCSDDEGSKQDPHT